MELEIVEKLCRRFPNHPALKLGPGDDAAILELVGSSPEIVVSADLLTEGVDFLLERMNPRKIGRKALAVNLSDLAAMAAEPLACVISVALPQKPRFPAPEDFKSSETAVTRGIFLPKDQEPTGTDTAQLMELLCDGFLDAVYETAQASEKLADAPQIATIPTAIAGGDTNFWDGPLVISVTIIGKVREKPLCRHHARPGDAIFVTGSLGGSILGRQFDFMPRIAEMLALNKTFPLHAGMDVSDGLTLDLARLCQRSKCRAELFLDEIPIHADAQTLTKLDVTKNSIYDWIPASLTGGTALDHALGDGEDFEILFTAPWELSDELRENRLGIPIYRIGRILESKSESTKHIILGTQNGAETAPIPIRGFQHGV